MSTKLQHRALRSQPQNHDIAERPRFTSMIVPIDRSAREDEPFGEPEIMQAPVVVLGATTSEAKRPEWLSFAATALTTVLLLPILCLALFPVSILALASMPLAALLYAASFGFRREDPQRVRAAKPASVPLSRAA